MTRDDGDDARRATTAPAREDADADADAVARLRAEHPRATLVARRDDDARDGRARTTVTCEETRHAVSWTGETREAGARAMRRHLSGKKFARATASAASEADLKQYEPHIVPSAFRKGYVFCRLTGARVRAREEAVVRHASGRRFERAHAAAAAGRTTLLEERDPVVEEAAREAAREAQIARTNANKAAKEARAEKMRMEKEAKRAEKAEARRAEREAGGFDDEMGCWVPPSHVLESDDDDESDDGEEDDEDDEDDEDETHGLNDLEDDFYEDASDSSDADEDDLPVVVAPGSRKRAKTAKT